MLEGLTWRKVSLKDVNLMKITKTPFNPMHDIPLANQILEWLENNAEKRIIRTHSGGIAKNYKNNGDRYDVIVGRASVEIIIHLTSRGWARVVLGNSLAREKANDFGLGRRGYSRLLKEVPELKKYFSSNEEENAEYKRKAKVFYVEMLAGSGSFLGIPCSSKKYNGKTLNDVWSFDLHKAFPTALAEIVPEAQKYVEKVKNGEIPKEEAVSAIGYMASNWCRYKGAGMALAKLRYQVLEKVANRINDYGEQIERQGGVVLNYRTDSIKFKWSYLHLGPQLNGEGDLWDYEFKHCKYAQYSTGAYEYIDNDGQHHVVLNGCCNLDKVKPDRSTWEWGEMNQKDATPYTWRYDALTNRFYMGGK